MFGKIAIINKSEKDFLEEIEEFNKEHNTLWKVPNLLIPMITILLALICFLAFSKNRWEGINYLNLIINGSLPLIAINQISAIGILVFKYDKSQEAKFGMNTFLLRTKLFWLSLGVLVLGIILFAYQVISSPFNDILLLIVMLIVSSLLVWGSSYVSRRIFLLQDAFIERTFDSDLREEAKLKHGLKWGKN